MNVVIFINFLIYTIVISENMVKLTFCYNFSIQNYHKEPKLTCLYVLSSNKDLSINFLNRQRKENSIFVGRNP